MLDSTIFQNPSEEYRIHPFWFWNGEMTDEQIEHQIAEMSHKGVGGFFICPRQGLQIPYLSNLWFDKVRLAIEIAKQHQMHVWLYDEYPYPSGIAGGEVTLEHPEAKHYTLVHEAKRVADGTKLVMELPWARIIYAKAVPLTENGDKKWDQAIDVRRWIGNEQADPVFQKSGLTAYNEKRFFTYRTIYKLVWDAPPGEWEVIVFQEQEIDDFKYYGTFVDPCNREAMATFIRLTHDRYAEHIGEHFGKTVKGMFTDEIGLLGQTPWSPQLPGFFNQSNGYDIRDHMHALADNHTPNAARIRYDYYQAIHLLLRTSYHKQVHDWCEQHGLQYVAEVPSVRMTTQLFSHVPGGDSAHEKLGRPLEWILRKNASNMRANPKMVSSLARQLKRDRNLIECFHSVGWSMTLQDAKWMIDRMAALGTNFYNFHAFFYTLDGLTKHDAPPSQFLQNPYWEYFRKLGDYTGRISYLMSTGKADIQIALLDPTTTLWSHLGNPFHSFNYGGFNPEEKQRLDRLREDWEAISVDLLRNRRDYDHLDPELLAEADVTGGTIRIGHADYKVLVLPPITNLEGKAWEKIKQFLHAGGTVISMGLLPHDQIEADRPLTEEALRMFGLTQPTQDLYWYAGSKKIGEPNAPWLKGQEAAYFIPRLGDTTVEEALTNLTSLLNRVLPQSVRLETERDNRAFLQQIRQLADHTTAVFISNQEGEAQKAFLTLDAQVLSHSAGDSEFLPIDFCELDLETGKTFPLFAERIGNEWKLPLQFAPYQAHLIQFTLASEAAKSDRADQAGQVNTVSQSPSPWVWEVDANGSWELSPQRHNAVRLETFRMSMQAKDDGTQSAGERAGAEEEGFCVKAKTFIDQVADVAEAREYPIRFAQIFGTPKKMGLSYPIPCLFATEFIVDWIPGVCHLFMDASAISGDWIMQVNGHSLTKEDFKSQWIYDHTNVVTDIGALIHKGINEIVVQVEVKHDWDGIVDALYVSGPFGVLFDRKMRPVITAPPATAAALTGGPYRGYPYYAGTLTWKQNVMLEFIPESPEFELRFVGFEVHDCVEVRINGQSLGVRPWSPYCWQGDSAILRQGDNEIEVMVTGSLIGLLEGKYFDYEAHLLAPVETDKLFSHHE